MNIRLAKIEDIPVMREIFTKARAYQLERGIIQWEEGYPSQERMEADIENEAAFVYENEENNIVAVLSVFTTPDPTYAKIKGEWLNDEPYATIHRIASDGSEKGIGQKLIQWVQNKYSNVRIDTHEDNQPMKHILGKLGFVYTGIIFLENGDPRDAYHYVGEKK